jgi:hypothetical protein
VFFFSFYWALLAAGLFTLSNGMTAHNQRVQLATVAFAPILAIFLWNTFNAFLSGRSAKFIAWGLAAGVFFGAWCLTCFYMAWYFLFFFVVFASTTLVLAGRPGTARLGACVLALSGSVIFVVASAIVSLLPFAYAFLAKYQETGGRSYDSVAANTVPLEGILQVGRENFMFGRIYNDALGYLSPHYFPRGEYSNTGFTIVLFFLFVLGSIRILSQIRPGPDIVLPAVVVATLVTWSLTLNIFGHSAWFFIYHAFPGAKALNVIATYQIFLALPVVIIAIKYLSTRRVSLPAAFSIAALLMAAEINRPYIMKLDRQAELARIALPDPPPEECRAFYASGWEGQDKIEGFTAWDNNRYAHNVTAMIIAQISRLPTVNGIASFNPRDWNFGDPNRPDYDARMIAYARKHLIKGLCRLDLNNKQWSVVE